MSPAAPKFDRNNTYLYYYEYIEEVRYYAEQTLNVPSGTKIYAHFKVDNQAETGKIGVQLWDFKNNEGLLWKTYTLGTLSSIEDDLGSFTADKDRDLAFIVYSWDGSNWIQADTLGC